MKFGSSMIAMVVVALVATSFVGAEEATKEASAKKDKKAAMAKIMKECKCPLSGKAVNPEKVVAYKDSKVFVCCDGCVKGFADKVKKDAMVAAKSNHQLVMTMQAKQAKCALNGKGKINKDAKTKVVGVEVNTCCKNCLAKVNDMEEKAQVELIFGKNFDKAFVVKAQKKKENAAKKKKAA